MGERRTRGWSRRTMCGAIRGDPSAAASETARPGRIDVSEAATGGAHESKASMKVTGGSSPLPDLPEGGELSPQRCALERPAVAWIGAEEPERGERGGARGERSAGRKAGATLGVAARSAMGVGVGLVGGWAPGGGEARTILVVNQRRFMGKIICYLIVMILVILLRSCTIVC